MTPPRTRRFVEFGLVCAEEGGVVLEAAAVADIRERDISAEQFACGQKPLIRNVTAEGVAGFLLEKPHQVVTAEMETARQRIYGQRLG